MNLTIHQTSVLLVYLNDQARKGNLKSSIPATDDALNNLRYHLWECLKDALVPEELSNVAEVSPLKGDITSSPLEEGKIIYDRG